MADGLCTIRPRGLFNFLDYHRNNPGLPLLKHTKFKPSSGMPRLKHGAIDGEMKTEQLHPVFTRTQLLPTGEEICLGRQQDYGFRTDSRADFRCLYCELLTLLSATYWSRVWIVPEFLLGREISINCMDSATTSSVLTCTVDGLRTLRSDFIRPLTADVGDRSPYPRTFMSNWTQDLGNADRSGEKRRKSAELSTS